MSSTIGSGYGILPQLVSNSMNVKQQLDTLTEQVSTGKVSQSYAGLGASAEVSLNLTPELATMQNYQTNINQASGSMAVTQTVMTQIQAIAATFSADIPSLDGLNASQVDSIASQANAALKQVAGLLNTQDGNNYLFSGQDTSNPAVPSGDAILSSGFYSQINAAVAGLSTGATASSITAATVAIGGSNAVGTSPFSVYLSNTASSISAPIHRVVHARPDDEPGDAGIAVQLADQRCRVCWAD
jgi:flagellar hook-associated protein 3 FlgL